MSMGFMVAAASRRRDDRGRYAEGDQGNRMGGDYGMRSEGGGGNYSGMEMRRRRDSRGRYMDGGGEAYMGDNYSDMGGSPEMRRRRDSRGRYMEGGDGNRMEDGGGSAHYWPGPHMPPYGDGPDMRRGGNRRRNESDEGPQMGGYGGFVWDAMAGGGGEATQMAWRPPHIPPYSDGNDMRDGRDMRPERERRGGYGEGAEMHMGGQPMRDHNVVSIHDYQDRRRIGFGEGDGDGGFDRRKAEEWTARMHGDDPNHPTGPKWTPEQVKPMAQKYGFPTEGEEFWQFYAIINAMYADNYETAKEYGLVKPEFFASLARNWLRDKDAVPDKIVAYLKYVVKR